MTARDQAGIAVRQARPDDAEAAASVLRASIADLCVADHGNDPEIVGRWLANKTPRDVRRLIEAPGRLYVAERYGRIVSVGAAASSGQVTLNYVLATRNGRAQDASRTGTHPGRPTRSS